MSELISTLSPLPDLALFDPSGSSRPWTFPPSWKPEAYGIVAFILIRPPTEHYIPVFTGEAGAHDL